MNALDEIWEFVPDEDDLESPVQPSAEELALHIDVPAEWGRRFDDPARLDVATADEDPTVLVVADDEDDGFRPAEADHELDVEELLERQHYSFAPSREGRSA